MRLYQTGLLSLITVMDENVGSIPASRFVRDALWQRRDDVAGILRTLKLNINTRVGRKCVIQDTSNIKLNNTVLL